MNGASGAGDVVTIEPTDKEEQVSLETEIH